jgi:hypothetical protein
MKVTRHLVLLCIFQCKFSFIYSWNEQTNECIMIDVFVILDWLIWLRIFWVHQEHIQDYWINNSRKPLWCVWSVGSKGLGSSLDWCVCDQETLARCRPTLWPHLTCGPPSHPSHNYGSSLLTSLSSISLLTRGPLTCHRCVLWEHISHWRFPNLTSPQPSWISTCDAVYDGPVHFSWQIFDW